MRAFVASVREGIKTNFEMTDAELDAMLSQAGRSAGAGVAWASDRALGDLSQCRSVKANRIASFGNLGVSTAAAVVIILAIVRGGDAPHLYGLLQVLGYAGVAISLYQLRHTLSLLFKITWYGSGPNTRRMLVLAVLGAVISAGIARYKDLGEAQILVPLLGTLLLITVGRVYVLARGLQTPEAAYLVALTSTADRIMTRDKIAAARRLTRRTD